MAEQDIGVLLARIGAIADDVGELKTAMREVAAAVTRLALVEERQTQTNEAVGRAFKQIEKIESRLGRIERDMPLHRKTSNWVLAAVWSAAGVAVMFALGKLGIKP